MFINDQMVIGVRKDGSRMTILDGLTVEQAEKVLTMLSGTHVFEKVIVETRNPAGNGGTGAPLPPAWSPG